MADAHSGTKAILAAMGANLGLAVTKLGAWALTGASSMLAEAVHSAADTSNQALLLLGKRQSNRAPDAEHPFGYGHSRYLYAFLVSIVLFSLGGLFALYEAWHKFSHPAPITAWHWVPVAVLVVGIILESFSLWTAFKEAQVARAALGKNGKPLGLFEYIRTSRAPEIPVILLEDTAALLGLVFALFGVSMTLATGDGRWDAFGSALIGVLLVVVAAFLGRETASMLLGEGLSPDNEKVLRQALEEPGDNKEEKWKIVNLRSLHLSPEEVLVATKITVNPTESASQLSANINAAEKRARQALPGLKLQIFIEPDLPRS